MMDAMDECFQREVTMEENEKSVEAESMGRMSVVQNVRGNKL